jgi:hypothetical protein
MALVGCQASVAHEEAAVKAVSPASEALREHTFPRVSPSGTEGPATVLLDIPTLHLYNFATA